VVIISVLLLSFDFWTVKNVSGRLLVGLRWWNEVSDDGASHWIFESHEDDRIISSTDKSIFWFALLLTPLIWGFFTISALFSKQKYLIIIFVAMSMNMSNVVGYLKCAKDAQKKLRGIAAGGIASVARRMIK